MHLGHDVCEGSAQFSHQYPLCMCTCLVFSELYVSIQCQALFKADISIVILCMFRLYKSPRQKIYPGLESMEILRNGLDLYYVLASPKS